MATAPFVSFTAQIPSFIRIILIMNSLYCLFSVVLLNLHCNLRKHIQTQVTTEFLLRFPSAEEHYSCFFLLNTAKVTFWSSCPNSRVSTCMPRFLKACETGCETNKEPDFSLLLVCSILDPATELVMTKELWKSTKTEWRPKLCMTPLSFCSLFLCSPVPCC